MKKVIWVLLDNRMGSVGQAKGIIQELNSDKIEIIEKKLEYSRWAGLPNFLRGQSLLGVKNKDILTLGNVPDLVISTSRRTAPVALFLKKKNKKTILTQLMFPGDYGINKFAKVFLPKHDEGKIKRDNFYFTVGSPHRICEKFLQEHRDTWQSKFSHLPKPWTAVIIGGSIKGKPFALENAENMALEIKKLKEKIGGSILVTDSRRTGAEAEQKIMNILKDVPSYAFLWGSKEENPLMGYYACADNFVVSGDSVSMCCEACGTGKPVFVFEGKDWLTAKHLRFTKSLFDAKYATLLQDKCDTFVPEKILYPSADIAKEIEGLLNI